MKTIESIALLPLILAIVCHIGCSGDDGIQGSLTTLELAEPIVKIPADWENEISIAPKGGETQVIDGPSTYQRYFSLGWQEFLEQYPFTSATQPELSIVGEPFVLSMARRDGFNACEKHLRNLEVRHGVDAVAIAAKKKRSMANE